MVFEKFIEWSFYAIVGGSFVYGVSVLAALKDSVEKLNQNVAIIMERMAWHGKELDSHEIRITILEKHSASN